MGVGVFFIKKIASISESFTTFHVFPKYFQYEYTKKVLIIEQTFRKEKKKENEDLPKDEDKDQSNDKFLQF